MIKAIYDKADTIFISENLKAFWLKSGIRQTHTLSQPSIKIVLEVLATTVGQGKEIKGIQLGREEVKLPLYVDDMWRRQWHPTPVLSPGNSHGRRILVSCSLWDFEESDTTE